MLTYAICTPCRRGVLNWAFACATLVLTGPFVAEMTAQDPKSTPPFVNNATSNSGRSPKPVSAKSQTGLMTREQVVALIKDKLSRNPYYSPGFLISHRDVEPIFNYLLEQGVTIAEDHEELYDSILPDNAYLVRLLKTPKGREFQKKLAGDADAYHRLDRLTWTRDGRRLMESFLDAKDGYARFSKLRTAADLASVSKQLAGEATTPDFELPTINIHTADELIQKIEQILARQKPASR